MLIPNVGLRKWHKSFELSLYLFIYLFICFFGVFRMVKVAKIAVQKCELKIMVKAKRRLKNINSSSHASAIAQGNVVRSNVQTSIAIGWIRVPPRTL
jgi:hypothetical protein